VYTAIGCTLGTRFSVIGTSGSGKTSTGRAIAERLSLPFLELDSIVHGRGWNEATDEELLRRIEPLLETDRWVVDGNYWRKLGDVVLERADTLVWLDLPLWLKLVRTFRRTAARIVRREELWNGNRESIRAAFIGRDSLFAWLIRSHRRERRELPDRLSRPSLAHLRIVRIRTPREVGRWLSELGTNE
jgi:adenylate kinase family enzyme